MQSEVHNKADWDATFLACVDLYMKHCCLPARPFTWAGGVLLIVATIVTQMAGQQRLETAKRRPQGTELVSAKGCGVFAVYKSG